MIAAKLLGLAGQGFTPRGNKSALCYCGSQWFDLLYVVKEQNMNTAKNVAREFAGLLVVVLVVVILFGMAMSTTT